MPRVIRAILSDPRRARWLVVLGAWTATFASGPEAARRAESLPAIGSAIPDVDLTALDGNVVRPADRRGRMLVLACVRERQALSVALLSDLQAEYAELRRNQIDVLAVAPAEDSAEAWRKLIAGNGIQFPVAPDLHGLLLAAINARVLPLTVVVDGNGRVAAAFTLHRASYRRDLWRQLRRAGLPEAADVREQTAVAQARQAALAHLQDLVRSGKAELAARAIDDLQNRYARQVAVRMRLGQALIELRRPAEAIEEFLEVLRLEPASLRARLWLGIAYARNGDDRGIAANLHGDADLLPDAWRAYGESGLLLHRKLELNAAAIFLRKSVAGQTDAVWTAGAAEVGSTAPMLEVIDLNGASSQPVFSRSRLRTTVILFWASDHPASLACLRRLQAEYARVGEATLAVAAVNVDKRTFSDADRASVLATDSAAGASFPIWLDANLESFARYHVTTIPTTVFIDDCGLVTRRIAGADLAALDEAFAASIAAPLAGRQLTADAARPSQAVAERYLGMARHLARQGREAAAIESARRCLADPCAPPGAELLFGRLLSASGRTEEAAHWLGDAAGRNPASAGLATAYADCLVRLGANAQAEECYRRTLKAHPEYAPTHVGLGRTLLARSATDEALHELRLAVHLNSHDEQARIGMAEVLVAAGRLEEAVQAYEVAYRMRWASNDVFARPR